MSNRTKASRRTQGFTLTEVLFSSVVGSFVIGACVGLYFAVGQRINTDGPRSLATTQAAMLAEQIDSVARRAVDVNFVTVGNHQRIEFKVPNTGDDIDGDTIIDTLQPGTIGYDGTPNYISGTDFQLVDFYWSDASGTAYAVKGSAPTESYTWNDGSFLWRGKGNAGDPLQSGGSGIDSRWSWIGDRSRFNLISNVTYSVDALSHVLTYTITARVKNVGDTQPIPSERSDNFTTVTLSRSVWMPYTP